MIPEHKEFYKRMEKRYDDPLVIDVKKAFKWFVGYMGQKKWEHRRSNVVKYFNHMNKTLYQRAKNTDLDGDSRRLAFHNDWIAWYLYLAESLADRPTVDEPSQSSRLWPFFATIGQYSDDLKKITGIDSKLHDLLRKTDNQPDSILFEFVVAICYIKNGWNVEFIPETTKHKTPDMRVKRGNVEFFVECKRLAKSTQYSERERAEWLKRWERALPLLTRYQHSTFINVEFKKEIIKTDENLVAIAVYDLISTGAVSQGMCIENEDIKVCAKHMDMGRIKEHFSKWKVKFPSPQLYSLFDDCYVPHGSYTYACNARLVEVEPSNESVLNIFADSITTAYCAKWECTDIESTDKKARDIKNLLVKAVKQSPINGATVIHLGYETLYGPHVEFLRDNKIVNILSNFEFGEKNIASIFCHSFQSRNFPDERWDFAETTRFFGFSSDPNSILTENLLVERDGTTKNSDTHWSQDFNEIK